MGRRGPSTALEAVPAAGKSAKRIDSIAIGGHNTVQQGEDTSMFETKDPVSTGNIVISIIFAWLVLRFLNALSALFSISALGGLGGAIAPIERLQLADMLDAWAKWGAIPLFIMAGVAVLHWIYVTNRNAHLFSDHVHTTPAWAVGWFFVPFANFIKPFEAFAETWKATVSPAHVAFHVPSILRWWWGLWIVRSIASNVSFRLQRRADTVDELIAAKWGVVFQLTIDLPLVFVLASIIKQFSAMQSQRLATSPMPIRTDDDSI